MEDFILTHGYWIIFLFLLGKSLPAVGSFISGNSALYIGGLLSGLGKLNVNLVIIAGLLAVLVGDNTLFLIGRYRHDSFPKFKRLQSRVRGWVEKVHHGNNPVIFLYQHSGVVRGVLPFSLGHSRMRVYKWLELVTVSSITFVIPVSIAGYFVGAMKIDGMYKALISALFTTFAVIVSGKLSYQVWTESQK